eukprot:CAMPEP_0196765336 /NCGR_PEP_ID=MMETSP1095-20130614/8007_1 /TAXON_ID=96789 ORGANISM="Chromulina nebulosa, Strain UTEXLB2642" /NCGR_SAMPLE_ID=MMETSP1095 /ASSEMBLY_ACC=CAM_ASM_000446 /LENGTH=594 /DNA_ID=CAMNT_0042123213 /DNA_START=200 /DNA_END=1980 /DNA_ORIENTATION=+
MNMNFELAFDRLGVNKENRQTYFRYDDTNPEAESNEYIQSLREDVDWLGWKPFAVTFTSDYFDILYEYAVELIKRGKAYICHQSKADIEASREIARAIISDPNHGGNPCSPWRDRPIEESLKEFEDMRKGKYSASEATLRMKMDMYSPNPNMWDQVAYRVKYVPHPHAGDKWCIYPTYDYTHCIIDSLEHIDYSICTLEFETRRESYYWVLEALDLYRPKVYEMSRLNITYTLLSKRKLLKLVNNGFMRGWDDPRMPTIKGLKRRGYTPEIINAFCNEIGVTRNYNVVQYDRLANAARNNLHENAPRVMAVLNPIKVILTNYPIESIPPLVVNDFPFDANKGTHTVTIEKEIYIDSNDFRDVDSEDYFGLAPGKLVNLKYAFRIRCDEVIAENGKQVLLCSILPNDPNGEKPKGTIHWVPSTNAVVAEVRLYNYLFLVEEPTDDDWEKQLNPDSEIVITNALIDPSFNSYYLPTNQTHYQFERIGFFVIDRESDLPNNKFIFNLTVSLKDSKPVSSTGTEVNKGANKSRKEEQAKQLAEKLARKQISPNDLFRSQTDLYSLFDEDGVPTHDQLGEKLSKTTIKKLRKEWEKQKL